jgi:hypothetical protein
MVVLPVDVGGDGAAHGDVSSARGHGEEPAMGEAVGEESFQTHPSANPNRTGVRIDGT